MSLIKKLRTGILVATAGLYSACNTTSKLDTSEFLSGHRIESDTQRDISYSLDTVVLAGREYVAKGVKSEMRMPGEGKFILYPIDNSWIVPSKKLELERETLFVPMEWDSDGDGKVENELKFRIEGPYNVKAEIKKRNLNKMMDVGQITQENFPYNLKKAIIGKEEHYVGITLTEDNKGIKEVLIMEKNKEGEPIINTTTGQIRVRGNTVYFLKERPTKEYNEERESITQVLDAQKKKETEAREELERIKEQYGNIPIVEPKK